MKIFVNGEPLDFVLENERTLDDVLRALSTWASQCSCRLGAAEVDGHPVDLSAAIPSARIEDFQILRVNVENLLEEPLRVLETLTSYIDLLKTSLEQGDTTTAGQLMEDYPIVRSHLAGLLPSLFGASAGPNVLDEWSALGTKAGQTDRGLLDFLSSLRTVLAGRHLELAEPAVEIGPTVRALTEMVSRVENISVLLQTGKDLEAMQLLVAFTEVIEKLIRLYGALRATAPELIHEKVDGADFPRFTSDFNGVLESLVQAFDAKDSVLIGDQLEYEIAPRALKLISYFQIPRNGRSGDGAASNAV